MRGSGTRMGAHPTRQGVLLDALGTLISFEPPAPRLRLALRERLGIDVGPAAAEAAIRAEIAYYRAHLDEGRDAASLADLRARCADAMRPALPVAAATEVLTDALLDALRFFAYPDAAPALRALRAAGFRTVVVSNWDHSLHERLQETRLAPLVDGALTSAEVGAAKPDRAICGGAGGRRHRGRVARGRQRGGRRRGRAEGRAAAGADRPLRRDRRTARGALIETLGGLYPGVAR